MKTLKELLIIFATMFVYTVIFVVVSYVFGVWVGLAVQISLVVFMTLRKKPAAARQVTDAMKPGTIYILAAHDVQLVHNGRSFPLSANEAVSIDTTKCSRIEIATLLPATMDDSILDADILGGVQ